MEYHLFQKSPRLKEEGNLGAKIILGVGKNCGGWKRVLVLEKNSGKKILGSRKILGTRKFWALEKFWALGGRGKNDGSHPYHKVKIDIGGQQCRKTN